jgi:hypothetical protein
LACLRVGMICRNERESYDACRKRVGDSPLQEAHVCDQGWQHAFKQLAENTILFLGVIEQRLTQPLGL